MRICPPEFEALLTPAGRRLLAGRHRAVGALAEPGRRFIALAGMIDKGKAERLRLLLERALGPHLSRLEAPIPPEIIPRMTRNYQERLPKTVRVSTAYLDRRRAPAHAAAEKIGLTAMLRSESFACFVERVAGAALRRRCGMQALRYGPGDYAGPHTDHHPQEPTARDGYIDCHLTLCGPGVARQWLVYEEGGHFSRLESVARLGGITIYRLPFWHYTTPLVAKPRREDEARRWVLLGTFLYRRVACASATART